MTTSSTNFDFLQAGFPTLYTLGKEAEFHLYHDPAALVEQLLQALLAKAFSGQLVPQDPRNEPASALLARLQAGAGAPAKGKRGRKAAPLFD